MVKDNIEYEAKILNIDIAHITSLLEKLGAKKINDYKFRRYVFDTIPKLENRWVRLRGDGTKTTLAVKEISSDEIDGTSEWEVDVSNIDDTLTILEKIGIKPRGYQENLRSEFELDGLEISIDSWPRLNPYLEIEGRSKDEVLLFAKKLGYAESDLTSVNTEQLYKDIGVNLKETAKLQFEAK